MTYAFVINGVLRSLPPNYKEYVLSYVMLEESFTFHEFLTKLRTLKVDPMAGEDVDGVGMFDIRIINVLFTNAYCGFRVFDTRSIL